MSLGKALHNYLESCSSAYPMDKTDQKFIDFLSYRLDQRVFSHTRRSSPLYTTQSSKFSSVSLASNPKQFTLSTFFFFFGGNIETSRATQYGLPRRSVINFLLCVLADVVSYTAHVPSFADTWGWVMVCYMFR